MEADTSSCESCTEATNSSRYIVSIIILIVLLVLIIMIILVMLRNAERLSDFYARNEERILQLSAKLTAVVVTMQIIVLVNENHTELEGTKLPDPYGKFVDALSFLALDMLKFVPMACISGRGGLFELLMVWTVVPMALLGLVGLVLA